VIEATGAIEKSAVVMRSEDEVIKNLIADAVRSVDGKKIASANRNRDPLTGLQEAEKLARLYPGAEITDAPKELALFRQEGPSCRFEAQDVEIFKQTGQAYTPLSSESLRLQEGIQKAKEMTSGATTEQIRAYANARGGRVTSGWLTLSEIASMNKDGIGVTAKIFLKEVGGMHQVNIWKIEYGPIGRLLGRPAYVIIHDSNFPDKLIRMRASLFDGLLVKPSMRYRMALKGENGWRYQFQTSKHGVEFFKTEDALLAAEDKAGNVDLSWYPKAASH
ncbi:MAG: hypothetical protein KGJ73_07060, partial [Rhodospirillales bacterium]|nr:hypothetical protein [Rhodospirillales bacterium]